VSLDGVSLGQRLAKQIEASGPISVAEYMRSANSEYYAKGDPLGAAGDFITAPEISQIFGELVGLWLTDMWLRNNCPADCHLVELGPGRGTLMADILRSAAKFDFAPTVHFVETSETLRALQLAAVPGAIHHDTIETLPETGTLLIIANEFFDALPVRQFVATYAGWRERVVARDRGEKFIAMPGLQAVDPLVPAEFRNAPAPAIYETSPQASGIMYELAGQLANQGGVLLIIDYGYTEPGLGDTLQAMKGHQMVDAFENPGQYDLTAHVNFLELANLARMRNLRVSGPVEQGGWLQSLGIDARSNALSVASPERAEDIKRMRNRLVEPAQMGSLFKVLAVSSDNWPAPEGFSAPKTII
jgi:NADH dehydrogenase [ubiquinone] 1 alpha subcomplex assembly factor 7